jgi:uncharacterized protein YndB with AHSA1/START domain
MNQRSVTHATFSIERAYNATPRRVFTALTDPEAKSHWFVGPDDWEVVEYHLDFRVGGREVNRGRAGGGPIHAFEALYQDIVPDQRIVYSYDMRIGDTRISVSLITVELSPLAAGTRLVLTEQGAFLDGWDDVADRERGTRMLLDQLGEELKGAEG